MSFIPKAPDIQELDDDAKRQYINARSAFTALEEARHAAKEVRGGMYWKPGGKTDYLIRTSPTNSQKSLGPRDSSTEEIYAKFLERKVAIEAREKSLRSSLEQHQRLNRALRVGRAPGIVVEILNGIEKAGLSPYFTVVGTHALYAYEIEAGIRITDTAAMETQDVDLLWDARKRVQFISDLKFQGTSMVGLLQKIDPTFIVRDDQRYTAVNAKGFEVDIIRREAKQQDPNPMRLSDDEDDFLVAQARRADTLLNAEKFSGIIVAANGQMARMNTISPAVFVEFKRWLSQQKDRDPLKRTRDLRQSEVVEQIVLEYLPATQKKATKRK